MAMFFANCKKVNCCNFQTRHGEKNYLNLIHVNMNGIQLKCSTAECRIMYYNGTHFVCLSHKNTSTNCDAIYMS